MAVDSGQLTVDSCFVKEIKRFLLWAIGSIHEVIYVFTAVTIAIPRNLKIEYTFNEICQYPEDILFYRQKREIVLWTTTALICDRPIG